MPKPQVSSPFFYVGHQPVRTLGGGAAHPGRLQPLAVPNNRSPSAAPSPPVSPPPLGEVNPTDAVDASTMQPAFAAAKRRLQSSVAPSELHSPAYFMAEITAFVESQLHLLQKRYPQHHLQQEEAIGDTMVGATRLTRLQEEQYRVAGASSLTNVEKARKARLEVFTQAQRMFADSFRTYKLFLDALADEHVAYDRFMEANVTRYKEIIAGMTLELNKRDEEHAAAIAALNAAHEQQLATVIAERDKLARQRQQLIDASKERFRETDAKKQLQELEHQLRAANDALAESREQCATLARQNEVLSIGTFSDALDAANQQLAEAKSNNQRKDDQLIEAHDEVAVLTRDLKKIVQFFNVKSEHPLTSSDVRLGDATLRALFPEEARKIVKY